MTALLGPLYKLKTVPGTPCAEYTYVGGEGKIKEAAAAVLAYMQQKGYERPADIELKVKQCPYIVLTENGVEFREASLRKRKIGSSKESLSPDLEGLNPEQCQAVQRVEGRTMVLAGPGSGKTRMIVARILYLISQGVPPEKIVAVTFTKKAAREMKERLGERIKGVTIKTFHSLGMQILKRYAPEIGYKRAFRVFKSEESIPIIAKALVYCRRVREWQERAEVKSLDPKDVYHMIEFAKCNRGLYAKKVDGIVRVLLDDIRSYYDNFLAKENAIDFADMLAKTHELFTKNKEALAYYQGVWSHLHVDEFQDTNGIQHEIAELLAEKSGNIFVVGDPKQSIYAWRGASSQVLKDFEARETQVVSLLDNYRCSQAVLDVAARLMAKTPMAEAAKQRCVTSVVGVVSRMGFATCKEEATNVIAKVQEHLQAGVKGGDIAVLVRTNAQIPLFQERCDELGISYFVRSDPDSDELAFYQEPEVQAAMAFLGVVADPNDSKSLIKAIASMKIVPEKTLGQLQGVLERRRLGGSVVGFCLNYLKDPKAIFGFKMEKKYRDRLQPFIEKLSKLVGIVPMEDAPKALRQVIKALDYPAYLKKTYPKNHKERLQFIEKLSEKAKGKSVTELLKPESDRVHIITLHCAKGLEFDVVFMVGMEEGVFPHFNAVSEDSDEAIEEERRLCYVGITRSKKTLYFSHAARRYKSAIEEFEDMPPSRFLKDLNL